MEAYLLTAVFLVAVNLIPNSLQISSVSDTISHKHVTYGHNEEGFAHNPDTSQNADYSSLPQLYRDALLKLNGTNYQEIIKNIGSGGKSVKITFKRKVKGSHKNYAKASHDSGYKTTDNSDPQNGETNFDRESIISKGHPKLMAVHHKNYITSMKLKKHAHKILPQDMRRTRFQSIYYVGNKHSAGRNKGDNYHVKYMIKNNHIKKAPGMSQYFVDDSFADTKHSGRSSIHHIKPKSERSYSKSWYNVPSIKRTVKLTKHVMKTKTKIPVNKLKEAGNGDINEIYDYSEEPMEYLSSENDNSEKPSSDEWVYEDIAGEKSNNRNENSKDIPIDSIFYKGLVEDGDHQANDLISEHKYPKIPAPSDKPPQGYQDVIFGDTSSIRDIDQDVVLKDASSAKVKILENNPNDVIVLENNPYQVFVEDNTFSSDNPKYIITDNVMSEDMNSKEKPIDVISKELSYNDQIPAEIISESPAVFNVTPNNIGSENDVVNNVPSENLSNQEQSSEDVSDKDDSEENTTSNTIKGIEKIPKIKNTNTKNDLVNISDDNPDASVKNIIWNRRPGKMIVYKTTSQHNVTKENIKLINYLRRKQMISALKGERSETATPVKIILDSRENSFPRDVSGENDSLKNANYENNDYDDLIPDVIKVPYTKNSPDPWLVKLETINKLVCHICGTAKKLLHQRPDTFVINRIKQIFNELKILNSNLKDYVPEDSDSIEGGEDETPNIDLYSEDNNEDLGDIEKPIALPIPDYETREKGKQKNPTGDVKNNLALILKLLKLLKHDAQKEKTISDDPNESNKDLGNNLPVPLLGYWYNNLDGKTPKSNKDNNDSLLDSLIETIKNNPEVSPKLNLKWYVKMNLIKILPVLQQNITTIRKIKNLIELLYKEFESNGKKDCQTDTYKKILKSIYNFLEFIMKLSENRRI